MRTNGVLLTALLAAALCLPSCHRRCHDKQRPVTCVDIPESTRERLLSQYPFDQLSGDDRDKLDSALGTAGRLCVETSAQSVHCNAGDTRHAEYRECCSFVRPPELRLGNLPTDFQLSDADGKTRLDLHFSGTFSNLALSAQCTVPTCNDDRVSGDVALQVKGTVLVEDHESVTVNISLPLEPRLNVPCAVAR